LAELEIHHENEHTPDPAGRRVGLLAAGLAVFLTFSTIMSHRTHTHAIMLKAEENDQWQYYQSKRIKFHNLELGEDLIGVMGPQGEKAEKALARYEKEKARYDKEGKESQDEARKLEDQVKQVERRGVRFDFSEGLLEIALVLTSLYFISHKMLFPGLGLIAGAAGIVLAGLALLI